MAGSRHSGSIWLTFLACLLAVPAAVSMLPGVTAQTSQQAVLAGALLGFAHILLRPVLRILSAPIGCLTLGLSGFVIDVALIYLCDICIDGFAVTEWTHAVLTAVLTNFLCFFAGRK